MPRKNSKKTLAAVDAAQNEPLPTNITQDELAERAEEAERLDIEAQVEPTLEDIAAYNDALSEPDETEIADVGDVDHVLNDAQLDAIAELTEEPAAEIETRHTALDMIAEAPAVWVEDTKPSAEQIAAALTSIDATMESAVIAGVVDHSTQMGSWISEETATEIQLESVVSELTASETPAESSEEPPAPEQTPEPITLGQVMGSVENDKVELSVYRIAREVDERQDYESDQNPDNLNIQRTLKKVRSQLVTKRAARLLEAISVDPAFINRSVHEGKRYNVYALGKLADIVYGVTDGAVANAINVACMKSLFAYAKEGITFTMEDAKGAASKNYAKTLAVAVRKHLISHTVAPGTAPTQASSTMQALVTLGVVKTNGAGKNPAYELLDTPIARKLAAMMEKIAA